MVKANAYGHGVARTARALGHPDGYAILEIEGALALRERFAGPILLLEGCFAARGARIGRRRLARRCRALRRAARDARGRAPVAPARRVPQGRHRHEPAGLRAGARPRGLRPAAQVRRGEVDHVDDALRERGPARRRGGSDAPLRGGHPGHRAAQEPRQFRGDLRAPVQPRRHRAPGHRALRRHALRGSHRRGPRREAGDDAFLRADRGARARGGRGGRLRKRVPRRARDAHRGRGVRIRRRLSAPRAHRHADRRGAACARGPSGASRWT